MAFNQTEKQERLYLKEIEQKLRDTIDDINQSIRGHEEALQERKVYLWESRMDTDAQEKRSVRENILNVLMVGDSVIALRNRLSRLLNIPYFGRIDFRENNTTGGIAQSIYIGIHTFYDGKSQKNLIYDWRAPISGMFYDYELGAASYLSPNGQIDGDISMKRQYRIRNGIMEYMIESSVTVHDDVLQKELSANADDKMKNIVATIQREQNRIIRNDDASVLIIQGVAGSGKTSIALHRVAYLLYAHKDTLTSGDILIISPNKVFADYISNVLPELGEETVPEMSMEQILSDVLDNKYKFQTFFGQVSELLNKPAPGFAERIRYKATFEFISLLDRFLIHIENNYFRPTDIKIRHLPIPAEYIREVFQRFHRYPVRERFDVMADYIAQEIEIKYLSTLITAERNFLKKEIRKMFAARNDIELYKEFFNWAGVPEMFKLRKNRTLEYSDLAPLAYLRIALDGLKPYSRVKHLLVDEMQDYSPIQYRVISRLFPCRKTILGDASQSVNPYGSSTADMIRQAFHTGEVMKLCKSYRSTYEITAFAQKIRANDELEVIERHGEEPKILHFENTKDETEGIAKLISAFRKSPHTSLGIICRDEPQASALYEQLQTDNKDILFLSSESNTFLTGIIVTSAHMAKGLEFDEVIIPHADAKNYQSDIDRSMLYVAVTRAMHKLTLTYVGDKITELIS